MQTLATILQNRQPTHVYIGKNDCCRCGCKGKYHDKGSAGYSWAIARATKLIADNLTTPDDFGNGVNFPHGNDRAIAIYFD